MATLVGIFLVVFGYLFLSFSPNTNCGNYLRSKHTSLKFYLFWNFIIRLVLQSSMDLVYTCILNVQFGQWAGGPFPAKFNIILAYLFSFLIITWPLFVYLWIYRNLDRLEDENFYNTYGSAYEGLDISRAASLWFPVLFMFKRIAFAVIALFIKDICIQLALYQIITYIMAFYLIIMVPYSEVLLN